MKNSPLIDKSKDFALEIIKVCNFVKQNKKETVLYKITPEARIVDKDTVEVMLPADTTAINSVCYARESMALLTNANLINSNGIPVPTFQFYKEG